MAEQVDGQSPDDLMAMVAKAAEKIQIILEIDSLDQEINEFAIKRVTTSSLEAYRQFIDGIGHFVRFDWIKAIPYFERAVENDSNFATVWLALANCYRSSGEDEKSQECFEQAKKLRDNAPFGEKLMIDAYDLWLQQNIPGHLEVVEKLLRHNPESKFWAFMKAQALRNLNQLDSAITIYRSLVEQKSRWPATYGQLAALYMLRGEREKALDVYRAGVEVDPGMLLAQGMLAGFADAEGDASAAAQYHRQFVNQAVTRGVDPIHEYLQVARQSLAYGGYSPDLYRVAIEISLHTLALDSTAYRAYYYMGLSRIALGDTGIAIETLNTFIANSKDSMLVKNAAGKIKRLGGGR